MVLQLCSIAHAQDVWIRTEAYGQEFLGVGGTADGWVHTWNRQSEAAKQQAIKLIAEDLPLNWIKHYPSGDLSRTNEFRGIARFYNDIAPVVPDVQIHVTVSNLPDELERKDSNGENIRGEIDDTLPNVYRRAGKYYFDILQAFHDAGLEVHELDLLNEPGGLGDALRKGRLYTESVDHLRNLINDPNINTDRLRMPKIAGPSHWSVEGSLKWINEWKANLPRAIDNLDIVTTHGYRFGWSLNANRSLHNSLNLPFYNNEQTGRLQEDDPLTAAGFHADSPDFIFDLSIAGRIIQAIQGGADAFFIFHIMNSSGDNSALIRTSSSGNPEKSRIYTGFKQVTALQPKNARRLARATRGLSGSKVLAMRKQGDSKVYLHIANINSFSQRFNIHFSDNGTNAQYAHSARAWVIDANSEGALQFDQSFSAGRSTFTYTISPYSVTSFEFAVNDNPSTAPGDAPNPNPTPSPDPTPNAGFGINADGILYHEDNGWSASFVFMCFNNDCQTPGRANGRFERQVNVTPGQTYTIEFKVQDDAIGQCLSGVQTVTYQSGGVTAASACD